MHIDLKIQLVLAHQCQFDYSKQFGESQQSGKFLHSYGTHNSSSNSGKLTEKMNWLNLIMLVSWKKW